jgi:hypothetical protein
MQSDAANFAPQGNNHQEESGAAIITDNISNSSEEGGPAGNDHNEGMDDTSIDSIGQFQTYQCFINNLDDSISLVEKLAKKL